MEITTVLAYMVGTVGTVLVISGVVLMYNIWKTEKQNAE